MPYVKKGNTVYKKEGGHMVKVGSSKNPEKYMRTMRAIEHGWKPSHGKPAGASHARG